MLETVIGDARDSLARWEPGSFDAIVLDVFSGADAPEHLTTPEFYAEAAGLLSPEGVLLVNVGDDPGLAFCRRQVRALQEGMAGISGAGLAALAEKSMFTGRYPGNIVLAATAFPWPEEWTAQLLAAGPHPADVLTGERLDVFASAA